MARLALVPVALALVVTAAAVPAPPGPPAPDAPAAGTAGPTSNAGTEGADALRLDGPRWQTGEASGLAPVLYTEADHQAVIDAAQAGMAYDVALDKPVNVSAGEVVIQPGRMLIARNDDGILNLCTIGFILGSPGSYQLTTAAHCLEPGAWVAVPSRYNPNQVLAAGTLAEDEEVDSGRTTGTATDWAVVNIEGDWQSNTNPVVWGGFGPIFGASEPPVQYPAGNLPGVGDDASSYVGAVAPWPVVYVGQPRPVTHPVGIVDTPVAGAGVIVEKVGRELLCECPVVAGQSGGPVVGPSGEAIGLISEWADRVTGPAPHPSDSIGMILGLKDDPERETRSTLNLTEEWKGQHELALITPMSEVPGSVATVSHPQQAAWGVAGCDPLDEPCPDLSWVPDLDPLGSECPEMVEIPEGLPNPDLCSPTSSSSAGTVPPAANETVPSANDTVPPEGGLG